MERRMSFPVRFGLAMAISTAAVVGLVGVAVAQAGPPKNEAYQGCKVGTLVILRQEVSTQSEVNLGEDYVVLRCDGWNWVPVER
jgi:hypothetical protein